MATPELGTWFVFVEGDVVDAAEVARYDAQYDAETDETMITIEAPDSIAARNKAGRLGIVLDWIEVGEGAKA